MPKMIEHTRVAEIGVMRELDLPWYLMPLWLLNTPVYHVLWQYPRHWRNGTIFPSTTVIFYKLFLKSYPGRGRQKGPEVQIADSTVTQNSLIVQNIYFSADPHCWQCGPAEECIAQTYELSKNCTRPQHWVRSRRVFSC